MKTRSRRTVAALVACLGLLGIFAVAVTAARAPDDKALAQGLRTGGFVIVVRHGPTFAGRDLTDSNHPRPQHRYSSSLCKHLYEF